MERKSKEGWVYLLRCDLFYKIGKAKDVRARVKDLQTANPLLIEILYAVFTPDMSWYEAVLHQLFKSNRTNGEWFEFSSDEIEKVKQDMNLSFEEYTDVGDDAYHLTFMTSDYAIHQRMRTAKEMAFSPDELEEKIYDDDKDAAESQAEYIESFQWVYALPGCPYEYGNTYTHFHFGHGIVLGCSSSKEHGFIVKVHFQDGRTRLLVPQRTNLQTP